MTSIDTAIVKKLKLPQMSQVGIVVSDIDKSVQMYADLLGIRPWYRAKIVRSDIIYKNQTIEQVLDIVVGYSGSIQFELIQVLSESENIYSDLINSKGQGLHHIGFVVSNISRGTEFFRQSGYQPLQQGTLVTKGKATTKFVYFDTFDECGYYIELIETTLYGISVGMSRHMMKLGKLFGDVDVITR